MEKGKPFKAPDCPECGEELLSGPWSQCCTNPDCGRARLAAAYGGYELLRKSPANPPEVREVKP